MSRRFKAGIALAVGCLLAAAGADARQPDAGLVYSPAPASTLVSKRDPSFKLAQVQRGASRVTMLAHQPAGAEPLPVASITSVPAEPVARVTIRLLVSPDGAGDRSGLTLATLEYLYALTMRQEPEARFCLADGVRSCDGAGEGRSHAELLRELAQARRLAVARASPSGASTPWLVVSLAPAPMDADQASVRITSEGVPMEGASVFFNRAPHSGCVAKSRKDGIASCLLVDQHGDDESHADEDKVPVVATFPGMVRAGSMLLPTTLVLRSAR